MLSVAITAVLQFEIANLYVTNLTAYDIINLI